MREETDETDRRNSCGGCDRADERLRCFSQTEQPPVSTAQPLPLAEAERVYVIEPAPGRQWLTDRDGNPVEAEQTFSLIYDQLTHQPQ